MELGEKLRQARLAAGLSQRQLCGETITRNMLSQIENGSAKPSMDTLRILAERLGKPISFFLEEQPVALPNWERMEAARQAQGKQVLELLEQYQAPDPVFDPERWLLEALTCLKLAREAAAEKPDYARQLLEQMAAAGEKTPYYTKELEYQRLLLCYSLGMCPEKPLPAPDSALMVYAQLAETPQRQLALLEAVQERSARWYCLRGRLHIRAEQWEQAAACYHKAEEAYPKEAWGALEQCYSRLEDYKKAYEYACKQRQ